MESITECVSQYGYYGLFSLLMLGIVGLPIPDETLLTFCGYLIYTRHFSFPMTISVAILGSIAGITLSYVLGRSSGLYLLPKYGRYLFITKDKVDRVHTWFMRRGKWVLVIGYYIPGIRHLTAYIAGATKLKFSTFSLYAYAGGCIWSLTFIFLGYFLGEQWQFVLDRVQENILLGTCVIAALIVILWLLKKKLFKF